VQSRKDFSFEMLLKNEEMSDPAGKVKDSSFEIGVK